LVARTSSLSVGTMVHHLLVWPGPRMKCYWADA
jgi:hypothetical protein